MGKDNLHQGHRQRVRENYLKNGIDGMQEHNVLEMLLFYAIPYKDTNELAHRLLERFGSLGGVLDADLRELASVDGMGENSAIFLKLCRDIIGKYNNEKLSEGEDTADYNKVLSLKYMGTNKEAVYLLALDSHGRTRRCISVADGTADAALADRLAILRTAIGCESTSVIIAHNHPNGFAAPSASDVEATVQLFEILKSVGITLCDHIIVADGELFSMAKSRKFGYIFR